MFSFKSRLFLSVLITYLVAGSSTARADRFSRQIQQINVRAYRNVMRTYYPSPLAQHFRGTATDLRTFVNNSVLQQDGPASQLVAQLLQRVAAAEASAAAANASVAATAATPDADLLATTQKTRDILKTLGVAIPPEVQGTNTPVPNTTVISPPGKDYSHYNETVN